MISIYGTDGFEEIPDNTSDSTKDKETGFFEWLMSIFRFYH